MMMSWSFVTGAAALIGLGSALAWAQTAPVGVYTAAQAAAGGTVYAQNCAGCHRANLTGGGDAPALGGNGFISSFGARSTKDLYKFIATSMPAGVPGSLSETQYTDVTAYLLQANGAPAGSKSFNKSTDVKVFSIATGKPPVRAPRAAKTANDAPLNQPTDQMAPAFQLGQTVKGTVKNYVDVTDKMLTHPPDGEWLMYRRNYQGWSFSPLKEITTDNVKSLTLKWAWNMNEGGASQVTPIVHAGVMFLSNTSNTVQALDARTGELIWENRIGPVSKIAYGGTRSLAVYHDKVYVATTDAHIHALDARTGKQVWEQTLGNPNNSNTGGVMVMRGKVLTGLTGCDNYSKNNCYISAFDAETGKRDWKFFTTALEGQPGGDTWNGLPNLLRGGGDTWIAGTYDPELNTTYWGVAQTKPWMRASRKTGNAATLYSSSTLALDPDTGKLKWYFQHSPGESLDLDEVFERVLIDHGDQKTLMTIGKVGLLWKLDRESGKFLGVKQTIFQNVFSGIDYKTGALTYRSDILNQKTNEWLSSCPGPEGGHDWQATSYDQPDDLLIIPLSQSCVMMEGHEVEMKLGGGGTAASQKFFFMPGTHQNMGRLSAYRTSDMKEVWSWQQRSPFLSAVLSTGGGLAFVGDFSRSFKAVDVKTGKIIWQTRLGNTVQGYPVSFSLDGKQFIAVTTGLGGGSPQLKPAALLDEVHRAQTGNMLYVFGLPD
ncbi:MAG TPA: PQQ-binding-like beta-propeller repeat protein [Acidobacteriaceae bacterium]|nr:PQQ-binding-like beta-propeller repeat protein [Acidobacteriaceae bacterium]